MSNGAWELAEDKIVKLELEKENYRHAAKWWKDKSKEQDKRIAGLEEAGRDLLIEAMNLYDAANYNPNRQSARQIFEDEIKLFGLPEGGADD